VSGIRARTRMSASKTGSVVEVIAGDKVISWPTNEVTL
jgi:hypothetical protein